MEKPWNSSSDVDVADRDIAVRATSDEVSVEAILGEGVVTAGEASDKVSVLVTSDVETIIVQQNWDITLTLIVAMIIAVSGWAYLLGHLLLQIIQTAMKIWSHVPGW